MVLAATAANGGYLRRGELLNDAAGLRWGDALCERRIDGWMAWGMRDVGCGMRDVGLARFCV